MTTAVAMTYDSLVDNIETYLERTDEVTIANIPLFIMLAEQAIAMEIKFLGNLLPTQSVMQIGESVIPKPARWHKTVSMSINVGSTNTRTPILLRQYEFLRNYWPVSTATGLPKYYSDYDYDHWVVAPTPDEAYQFEVLYYQRLVPLDSANQTNWLTRYAPQALLYGSLLQAMPFLKNDDRIPAWQAQYQSVMTILKGENTLRVADRQAVALDN